MEGKCLKRILTYLYFTKYNEINVRHLDIKKRVSNESNIKSTKILYTSSHKSFLIHYVLREKIIKRILTYLYCT